MMVLQDTSKVIELNKMHFGDCAQKARLLHNMKHGLREVQERIDNKKLLLAKEWDRKYSEISDKLQNEIQNLERYRETLEKEFQLNAVLLEFDLHYTLQIEKYTTNFQFRGEEIIPWENTQELKLQKIPKMSAVISLRSPKEEKIDDMDKLWLFQTKIANLEEDRKLHLQQLEKCKELKDVKPISPPVPEQGVILKFRCGTMKRKKSKLKWMKRKWKYKELSNTISMENNKSYRVLRMISEHIGPWKGTKFKLKEAFHMTDINDKGPLMGKVYDLFAFNPG